MLEMEKKVSMHAPSSFSDTLAFELLDIDVDYGPCMKKLQMWEVGSK